MAFSDNLKALREFHKLTQDQLSKSLGISKSTISMYEQGRRNPDFETLESIADYFNTDMNHLLGLANAKKLATSSITNEGPNDCKSLYVSAHEEIVITAYRSQPDMQPAVDRLLGVAVEANAQHNAPSDVAQDKPYYYPELLAAYDGTPMEPDDIKPLTKEQFDRASKIVDRINKELGK